MQKVQTCNLTQPLQLPRAKSEKHFFHKLNFEFMDLAILPKSLRSVLRDILEFGNGAPFRKYYQWTTTAIYDYARKQNIKQIVELGAGTAPLTRHLIKQYPHWDVTFKITDLNPDVVNFQMLQKADKRVTAEFEPLDFSKNLKGYENSLLVLSGTFHHLSEKERIMALANLKLISPHVMIFEPLRSTATSFLFVFAALLGGFLTPLFHLHTRKCLRTILWCWLIPVAPFMFLWDGWISVVRIWSKQKWLSIDPKLQIEESLFCSSVMVVR